MKLENQMKVTSLTGIFILAATTALATTIGLHSQNTPEQNKQLKTATEAAFQENGFNIVGTMDEHGKFGSLNGCYTLKKVPDNGLNYVGCANSSPNKRTQVYGLRSLDAPTNR